MICIVLRCFWHIFASVTYAYIRSFSKSYAEPSKTCISCVIYIKILICYRVFIFYFLLMMEHLFFLRYIKKCNYCSQFAFSTSLQMSFTSFPLICAFCSNSSMFLYTSYISVFIPQNSTLSSAFPISP